MGNVWVLLIGMVFIGLGIIYWIKILVDKVAGPDAGKTVSPSRFERINEVEGILYADGKQIKTFNIGRLVYEEQIRINFFNHFGRKIQITDIVYNGQSIYSFAPLGMSYREKADYTIQVLKLQANQGVLPMDLIEEIEETILEVDNVNEYIESGNVVQVANDQFAWQA